MKALSSAGDTRGDPGSRWRSILRRGSLVLIFGMGWCVAGPVAWLQAESPPPLRYAPTGRYPLDDTACRAKLEPGAARNEEYYRCKIDFARLEHDYPLTRDDLKRITRDNIKAADQEQLDQIYARLTAGPIPDGSFAIELFRPRDFGPLVELARLLARERMDPLKGLALLLSMPDRERASFLRLVWQGKVFNKSRRIVLTRIGDLSKLAALVPPQPGRAPAGTPSSAEHKPALLLPAKVYCGQSLLDGRRESIIVDYAFSHDIAAEHRKDFVWMMGPDGLGIRDEIRMVRPGFYLGRAYMGRIFAVNFLLYKEAPAGQDGATTAEDCEIGSQRAAAAAR